MTSTPLPETAPRARVFIPQVQWMRHRVTGEMIPKVDLAPAREFGPIIELITPGREVAFTPETSLPVLAKKLADFGPLDYFIPMGSPVIITWAAMILARRCQTPQILMWDDKYGRYDVIGANLTSVL